MSINLDKFLLEEDVEERINEQLDFTLEDEGIGSYEFWGTDYFDKNMVPHLTTTSVVVEYYIEKQQGVYVILNGCYNHDEMDIYWCAELENVQWNKSKGYYEAEYTISEE